MARRSDPTWIVTVQDTETRELMHVFGPWSTHDAAEHRAVQLAMALSIRGDLSAFYIDVRRVTPTSRMESSRLTPRRAP